MKSLKQNVLSSSEYNSLIEEMYREARQKGQTYTYYEVDEEKNLALIDNKWKMLPEDFPKWLSLREFEVYISVNQRGFDNRTLAKCYNCSVDDIDRILKKAEARLVELKKKNESNVSNFVSAFGIRVANGNANRNLHVKRG